MTDSFGVSTIRVEGQVGNKRLHILIDNDNTHNFLDLHTANKLGCDCLPLEQLQVTVANDNRIPCKYVCKGFTWFSQGCKYYAVEFDLKLGEQ